MLPICRNCKGSRLRQIGTTGNLRMAGMRGGGAAAVTGGLPINFILANSSGGPDDFDGWDRERLSKALSFGR